MDSKFRHFEQRLRRNGFVRVRITGSHYIYKGVDGQTISVNKDLNEMVRRRLVKEYHLA